MYSKTDNMVSSIRQYFCPTPEEISNLNISEIFKPIYYVLTALGLFPFSVKYNDSKGTYNIIRQSIYVNSLCAVSNVLFIYSFFFAHVLHLYTESSSFTNAMMTELNYILELSTLIMFCSIAYFCSFLNRYKYVRIINSISLVWNKLRNDFNNQVFSRIRFQVHIVVMGSLFVVLILQLCVNSTRSDSVWKVILVTFSFIYPQMIQMVYLSFHYTLITMLVGILTDINEEIKTLAKQKNFIDVQAKVDPKQLKSLRQLELAYGKAYEIKNDINEAFQGPILMSTLQCFHSIVSETYILYHGFVVNSHTTHVIVNCSIWVLYQLLKVYSLSYSGDLLRNEGMKIAQSLHNLPTEKQDMRMLLEIQHFVSLINYQRCLLTVYGYFPMDATIMFKMIATATMYIIILVQFDKAR